ncbi:hypothetical protein FIV00_02500 [Labrenzia sp. THAF82]|uniref:hypothetical protein n=1 Tax=Labrenzia sp. THAF82 TaxID=2587861 RepID=UPI001267957B|nr:hypothetical protein [Labrenzia sp. THAF82]QFT29347.1 hypothetical protein FIV00_02500 [Labrenzia sp. THAF82]
MQVRPVSAIHALRIRQKPSADFVPNSDLFGVSEGTFAGVDMMPAHLAAEELQRDLHAGSHAEYATQLLASRNMSAETEMERQQHLAQYATASEDSEETSFTISLSA